MSDEKRLPPWRLRWDDEREWVTQNQATLPGRVFGHYYEYVTGEWGAVTETDAGAVETEHATASEAREACEARLRDLEYVVLHAPRRVAPIPSGTPRHTCGRAPLGYRLVDKRLVVDADRCGIVRQLFAWCIEGVGVHEIGKRFRARYPSVPGRDHAIMARRLRNRVYLGSDRHEAIVDAHTFELAQQALAQRGRGGHRPADRGANG